MSGYEEHAKRMASRLVVAAFDKLIDDSMPELLHEEKPRALELCGTLDGSMPRELGLLLVNLAAAAGASRRLVWEERQANARRWWAPWRPAAPGRDDLDPVLTDDMTAGEVAAAQIVSAVAHDRREDAFALLDPWRLGQRGDEAYAYLLAALLTEARRWHYEQSHAGQGLEP